jgi:hypothetical protein
MKINRFNINESRNNPLLDEPWTIDKFKKIQKTKRQIKAVEDSLNKLLTQYLLIHPDIQDEEDTLDIEETKVVWYEFLNNPMYIFSFSYYTNDYAEHNKNESSATLTKEQFNDLLIFLNEPDLYINSNKYNL